MTSLLVWTKKTSFSCIPFHFHNQKTNNLVLQEVYSTLSEDVKNTSQCITKQFLEDFHVTMAKDVINLNLKMHVGVTGSWNKTRTHKSQEMPETRSRTVFFTGL